MPNDRTAQVKIDHGSLSSFCHLIRRRDLDRANRGQTMLWSPPTLTEECNLNGE